MRTFVRSCVRTFVCNALKMMTNEGRRKISRCGKAPNFSPNFTLKFAPKLSPNFVHVGEIPNEIVFRGIQDVLKTQLSYVSENVDPLRTLRDSLYAIVSPLMSDITGILSSDQDANLDYLNGESNKVNTKDIYKNFKTPNRDRVDRTLSSLQNTVSKIHLQLQNLVRIYDESKKNSVLSV